MRHANRVMPIAAALLVAIASGCVPATAGFDKAGGLPPVVLRLAGAASLREAPAVGYFVRRVDALSDGALRIEVLDRWKGPAPGAEWPLLHAVTAGDVDLGWVGSSVFAYMGLPGFDALTAPMLIDSSSLEDAVLQSPIPDRMLRGLSRIRLAGLGILAEGLARPVAVDGPLLDPADWRGLRFGMEFSGARVAAIETLGAVPVQATGGSLERQLGDGQIQAFGLDIPAYVRLGLAGRAAYVTGNVTLWPRWDVLLVGPDALASLTQQERSWVRRAAQDAVLRSATLSEEEAGLLGRACRGGAKIAIASPRELAATRHSFDRVYRTLEEDRTTKSFIQRIEALKGSIIPASENRAPAGCRVS
jgi:TRAP-type C4-dicarboxylate transport system substrate-binding protein